ncbi:MAG: flippase activity-associated protein Agl23 [Chloroflexota bacterium]
MAVDKENRDQSLLQPEPAHRISSLEIPGKAVVTEVALENAPKGNTSRLEFALEGSEDKIMLGSTTAEKPTWKTMRGWLTHRIHFRLTLEGTLYTLILLLAIFMRLWDLDVRALHHDEGVHAYYSWRYYNGGGYDQEPWKHGPFLYHITSLSFWLFGPSDFTARLPTALFGVLICLLPLALRRELGRWGALSASLLLAISPTLLYFSRFLREDIFMAFATLLLFIGLVRFVKQPSARWWYVAMAALGLLYCTKEASYFYTALFGGFIFLWMCWQIAPRLIFIFVAYLGVAAFTFFFVAGLYTPPPIPFEQINKLLLTKYLSELIVHPIFWTVILLLVIGLVIAWLAFKEAASTRREFLVATGRIEAEVTAQEALFLPYQAGSPAYAIGWLGRHWKITGIGLLILFGIYSVFYTGFFSSPAQGEVGLISGLWYWIAQQGVERGSQPWYYYFLLMPLYEPLALLFGTLGGGLALFQFVRHSYRRPVRRVRVAATVTPNNPIQKLKQAFSDDELDELDPVPEWPRLPDRP